MFKHLLETNEVEIDDDGDNEPSAHLLAHLINVLARFGNGSALCLVFEGEGKDGRIISHLLDAGLVAEPILEKTAGAILMSGTLDPPHMFADLLGIPKAAWHWFQAIRLSLMERELRWNVNKKAKQQLGKSRESLRTQMKVMNKLCRQPQQPQLGLKEAI